jgi:hypothetical protein
VLPFPATGSGSSLTDLSLELDELEEEFRRFSGKSAISGVVSDAIFR